MTSIQTSIARVRRRVFVNRLLSNLGWAVMVGLVVASLVMVADKLMPLTEVPLWVYAIIAGVAAVGATVFAFGKLPDEADAAVLLDDKLGLKDKLGTAMYTATLEQQNELTEQIAREADEAAMRARTMVSQAAPISLAKVWNWTPFAAALLLGVMFFMPANAGDPLGQIAKAEEEAEAQELAEKGAEVIINMVDQNLNQEEEDGEGPIAVGLPDELADQLVSISDEIRKDPSMAAEKLKEAEALVSDAQDQLADQVDVVEAAFNPLKNDATGLDAGQPGPADEFTKAMNRGDFEKAKEAIEELQKQIENGEFDQQTRQQLQQQLNNLANQVQQQAQQSQQRQQQAQQQAQQQMQQQLQNSGMSQQQAQQLAQQAAQQMQQQQQGQQAQQGQQNQQGQQQGQQSQQQANNNQQGQQGQGQQQSQQQVQQQIQQALQQQGMSQQQAQQQAQQMMQQMQQQMQQAQGQGQCSSCQGQLSQGLRQMANQAGGQQGQQGQGQQGQGQGQQGQGGQSAQQAINQMAQMQQQLQRMQQQQAQMQQAMNQLNQAQGGQGGQGGQQQAQGGGQGSGWGNGDGGNPYGALQPGYQHNSYAANDIQQGEGRVIASWSENGEAAAGEATVEFNASRTEAVQSAERAVTEDRVPRRYHESIKEYFQQLPEDPDAGRAPAAPR